MLAGLAGYTDVEKPIKQMTLPINSFEYFIVIPLVSSPIDSIIIYESALKVMVFSMANWSTLLVRTDLRLYKESISGPC